ncbi:MAG: PQQ-dependent sugar dehydrogenase [Thermodesulfobacteriota bacterium]
MKKPLVIISILLGALGLWAAYYYWQNVRGAGPALRSPPQDISRLLEKPSATPPAGSWNEIDQAPLKLPPGFEITIFARDLKGARVLALDPEGTLLVSLTRQGRVMALPDKNADGVADEAVPLLDDLNRPHGLAFGPEEKPRLYVAETDQVAVYDYDPEHLKAANKKKIIDLPPGGRHFTRTLLFLPPPQEYRLLISVGSSCDVCEEKDWRYSKILALDVRDGSLATFASGLRNSVFMALHPLSKHLWATEMGRDFLGDDLPPDEINLIMEGANYGWPWCYGKRIHDGQFDPSGSHREFCKDTIPSFIDMPAHSAPLGLAFFPKSWPQEFRYNLLVAYHGSWNRSEPTGYKVVRYKLDTAGNYLGCEDFITGWLTPAGALGRPVDILIKDDGEIFISDDKAGVVYRVAYK